MNWLLMIMFVMTGFGGIPMQDEDNFTMYITRAADWSESEKNPITLKEWTDYVIRDKDLALNNLLFGRNPRTGKTISIKSPGAAIWRDRINSINYTFVYIDGRIEVALALDPVIEKMKQVAAVLKAFVMDYTCVKAE